MAWRTPWLLLVAYKRFDLIGSALTALLAVTGLGVWQDLLPWWAPWATLGVLLLYGLLMANYEEVSQSKQKSKELEEKLTTDKKRADFKDLLTKAWQEGQTLQESNPSDAAAAEWAHRVSNLIFNALNHSDAQRLYSDTGLMPMATSNDTPVRQWIRRRQERIDQLSERVDRDSLELKPTFNPEDWENRFDSGIGD